VGLAPHHRPRPGVDPQSRAARLLSPEPPPLDPQVAEILERLNALRGPAAHEVPVEQARAGHDTETEQFSGAGDPVAEVRDLEIPSPGGPVPARAIRPEGDTPMGVVAYLHGGGWVLGSLYAFEPVCRRLANESGAIVVAIDYRLSPEHPFPAALNDTLSALRWLSEHAGELGGDPDRLAVAGDSAGGNLSAVAARRLRGEIDLRLQALIYPVTDAAVNTPSYRDFGEGYGLTAASMQRYWRLYLDGADGLQPDCSPLRAGDLEGLPPAFVLTADRDPLRDEGEAYAAALTEAGVPVQVRRFDGTVHGFWRWLAVTDVSHEAVRAVGGALRAALA
jgi:acetyl esterase